MQENRFRHKLKTAEGVNQTLYPIIDPIEGTYAQLLALKNAARLIPGQWYKMNDYQTIWKDPVTNLKKEGSLEVIFLFAVNINEFDCRVISKYIPSDIIYYSITNFAQNLRCMFYDSTSKGFIYRRISANNCDFPYDFRKITPTLYNLNLSSFTIYNSMNITNKGAFITYNNKYFIAKKTVPIDNVPIDNNEYWIKITDNAYFVRLMNSTFVMKNNNNNINLPIDQADTGVSHSRWRNIKVEPLTTLAADMKINLYLNNINFGYLGDDSARNIYIGENSENIMFLKDAQNIKIGANCKNNVFLNNIKNNVIGNNCQNNFIYDSTNNIIGDNFQYNTVGRMIGNQIGNDFQENLISDDFNYNIVGHKFQKKTIKNGFQYKKIDSNLTEEKDLDSHEKLFDNNLNIELTKGYDNIASELKYAIRFFDPITEADAVNVLE